MTGKILLVLATFALGGSVHGASRSTTAVALKDQAYKDGFRNCSRGMPPGITAAWQVSQKDVEKIDAALMLHMEEAGLTKKLRASPASYGRQYLGYVREGRRFVYVNAFLRSFGVRAPATCAPATAETSSGALNTMCRRERLRISRSTGKWVTLWRGSSCEAA